MRIERRATGGVIMNKPATDPIIPSPWFEDWVSDEVPRFLEIIDQVKDASFAKSSKVTLGTIAQHLWIAALYYRQGKNYEETYKSYRELKKNWPDPTPFEASFWGEVLHMPKGKITKWGDRALIWRLSELKQMLDGHNAEIGWGRYRPDTGLREKSGLQIFCEECLKIIDPKRDPKTYPKPRYYSNVKDSRGLVMPMGA